MRNCIYHQKKYIMASKSWQTYLKRGLLNIRALYNNFPSKNLVYGYPKPFNCANNEVYFKEPNVERIQQTNLSNIYRYIEAYRQHGHKLAKIDPLGLQKIRSVPELTPFLYGIDNQSEKLDLSGLLFTKEIPTSIEHLTTILEREYCSTISAEFTHICDHVERQWFTQKFESKNNSEITTNRKVDLAKLLLNAEAWDKFLAVKFSTLKRYSGEGNETFLVFIEEVFRQAISKNISNIVMCMAHRGRLNLLTTLLNYPPAMLYRKIKGLSEFPAGVDASGDVLSHAFTSTDVSYNDGSVHVSFIPNPSHLEICNPVAEGKARSIQQTLRTGPYNDTDSSNSVLCLQVHGDAAVSGQGVITETLAFAECPHYTIGGTIHLITNNQIGFTTATDEGRSSMYCSDFAKINGYPILHVNGDDPHAVIQAAEIAVEYRNKFQRDIVIDLVCYRRWGHNELDEPAFTQPLMYNVIRSRDSIPSRYLKSLTDTDSSIVDEITQSVEEWKAKLNDSYAKAESYEIQSLSFQKQWSGYKQASHHTSSWDTGLPVDILKFIGAKSVQIPDSMEVHSTLKKAHVDKRLQRVTEGTGLDWATCEALAVGSLLLQGYNARISGQDVARGTFSHRHAILVDQKTGSGYIPLNNMVPDQKHFFELANSILSEEAVMAFEFGFSLDNPRNLVMWEAQFGDFYTGAQIVVDTFLTSCETKWLLQCGLVLLLPHGYDGAGPEHTSCRIERFLQSTDSSETSVDGDHVNIAVVNPTTPSQYFHLLRRQMVRDFRKPLVVVAPKVLLKHPSAVSSLADMAPETTFLPVLLDASVAPDNVTQLVFCSGKYYYSLAEERLARKRNDIAFIRLESLCPFPAQELRTITEKYKNVKEFIWCQEEHRNMGAWTFVAPRFENILGIKLQYRGRSELATPAVGIGQLHQAECAAILDSVFN